MTIVIVLDTPGRRILLFVVSAILSSVLAVGTHGRFALRAIRNGEMTRAAKQDVTRSASQFAGRGGRRKLVEAIKSQVLVSRDDSLARAIVKNAVLESHAANAVLMTQGAPDNDMLFILSGGVSIRINGREVAVRRGGTHVGEMALVDYLQKRSATVVATESTITLRLTENVFSRLAAKTPDLWRRVAVEIASRLRERSANIRQPNNQPIVFIGSSTEGLKIASEVDRSLSTRPVVRKLWTANVFQISKTAIESLVELSTEADFAILVFTPDDLTISRSKKKPSPRDNVIFELGLFMGALGRNRVVILKPKNYDIKIPTDLLGVTWIDYSERGKKTFRARFRPVNSDLWKLIKACGSR